jgi:murein DD-endopeptidase MepM/ murein hydrolase activator NlpD
MRSIRILAAVIILLSLASAGLADKIHLVKKGETLYGIAHQYGIAAQTLKAHNKLSSDALKAGQKLKIPETKTAKAGSKKPAPVAAAKETKPAGDSASVSSGSGVDELTLRVQQLEADISALRAVNDSLSSAGPQGSSNRNVYILAFFLFLINLVFNIYLFFRGSN